MLVGAARKRFSEPTENNGKVLLLECIHYLAAALDPRASYSQAIGVADDLERALRAIHLYLIRSPTVLTGDELQNRDDDVLMGQIRAQFTTYAASSGSIAYGSAVARKLGASLDLEGVMTSNWDLWGWCSMYGESALQLKAIGQQLAGMAPSSCSE